MVPHLETLIWTSLTRKCPKLTIIFGSFGPIFGSTEYFGTFPYRTSLSTGVPFRKPENVPKIFPKQDYENVRNPCLFIFGIPENFENFAKVRKFWVKTLKILKAVRSWFENTLKTVLARSGAEINSFLCFDHFLCFCVFCALKWTSLTRKCPKLTIIFGSFGPIFGSTENLDRGFGHFRNPVSGKFSENFRVFEREPLSISLDGTKIVPKYSCFGYRFSRYIFPKKLGIPKLLPKRMALILIWATLK